MALTKRDGNYFAPFLPQKREDERGLPPGMAVCTATREDVPGMAALLHEREGGRLDAHIEQVRRDTDAFERGERRLVLVAKQGDSVMGFGRVGFFDPPSNAPTNMAPPGWYLLGLVVGQAWRRRGIGAALTHRRLE